MQRILSLTEHGGWNTFRERALEKLAKNEASVTRLLFRTRTEVDPIEVEFFRGFRQGVMFLLDGLPNTIRAEYERALKESDS